MLHGYFLSWLLIQNDNRGGLNIILTALAAITVIPAACLAKDTTAAEAAQNGAHETASTDEDVHDQPD